MQWEEEIFTYKGRTGLKMVFDEVLKADECMEMGNSAKFREVVHNFFMKYQLLKKEKGMKGWSESTIHPVCGRNRIFAQHRYPHSLKNISHSNSYFYPCKGFCFSFKVTDEKSRLQRKEETKKTDWKIHLPSEPYNLP
jgi:hypothetical protein